MPRMFTHPANATGPTYVGNRLVYPGDTVMIEDEGSVKMVDVPASTTLSVDIPALQQMKVSDILSQLPDLNEAQLEQLLELEQKDIPRSTVVTAVEQRMLKLKAGAV